MDHPPAYTADTYTPADSIGRLVNAVAAQVTQALDSEASPLGISSAQWIILIKLGSGQARTAAELCRLSHYDTGSMTRMLDRLEKKGLITRVRSAEDRRVVELFLTEAGHALYPRLPPISIKVLNRYLQGFAPGEVETLKVLLRRMLANGGAS
jgi:DNA-binding MarR family transcriptional regulator